MPCNFNYATGEVETLLERYQREAEDIKLWEDSQKGEDEDGGISKARTLSEMRKQG